MRIQELLQKGYNRLKKEEIDSYLIDCQLIMAKVLKVDRMTVILNKDIEVEKKQEDEFLRLVSLRERKMPVKYLLEECDFMGINFYIKEGVLIPRPDTEILVEEVLKDILRNRYTQICDVCSGSGAIGLSIAKLANWTKVECMDISSDAEEVTKVNIHRLNLENRVCFKHSDLLQYSISHGTAYDVIVSNPPYIRRSVIPTLMEDVKNYEPYIALCGGEDGLDFYRQIVSQSVETLRNGGVLAFEIGYDQREEVMSLMDEKGFENIKCIKDLSGKDRVVKGIKSDNTDKISYI